MFKSSHSFTKVLGLIPNTHMVVHNCLPAGIQCPLLAFMSSKHAWGAQICMQKKIITHKNAEMNQFHLKIKKQNNPVIVFKKTKF